MTILPSDEQVIEAIRALRSSEPELGRPKVLAKLKEQHQWALSIKRLKELMVANDLESTHVSKLKDESDTDSPAWPSTSKLPDSRSDLLASLERTINSYPTRPPDFRRGRGTFDLVGSFTGMFNAVGKFPAIPNALLLDAYDLKSEHVVGSDEYRSMSPPEIPENAIAAQLKYREESTRQLIIYGRGQYNFGITPNSQDGIHYTVRYSHVLSGFGRETYYSCMPIQTIFGRYSKRLPYNVAKEDQRKIANAPDMRMIWEFYEQSAQQAGVSREDVGKQFEAE